MSRRVAANVRVENSNREPTELEEKEKKCTLVNYIIAGFLVSFAKRCEKLEKRIERFRPQLYTFEADR